MNIPQLQIFASVAQFENMSRVSEALHISQSAISKNLAKLEAELGVELFEREGKKLHLNAAGARFLKYCNAALQELELAEMDVRMLSNGMPYRIRICVWGGADSLMPALAEFRELHPNAEFELSDCSVSDELPDINSYDAVIYPDEMRFQKWTGYSLQTEKTLLAVPVGHPLAGKNEIGTEDLAGQNVIFLRLGKGMMENAFQVVLVSGVAVAAQSVVESRLLHMEMISAGLGVGFVQENSAGAYRDCRGIRLIPVTDPRYNHRLKFCFRREKHLSPIAKEFCDFLKRYYRRKEPKK